MASIKHTAAAIAAILVRDGVDYAQSKAVFKAARERAGLRAAPEHRGGVKPLHVARGTKAELEKVEAFPPHRDLDHAV